MLFFQETDRRDLKRDDSSAAGAELRWGKDTRGRKESQGKSREAVTRVPREEERERETISEGPTSTTAKLKMEMVVLMEWWMDGCNQQSESERGREWKGGE